MMSKHISRLLILFVVVSALVAAPIFRSSAIQQKSIVSAEARNAALVAATEEVLKETSEIRELAILKPVKSSAESRATIEQMLIRNLEEETTPSDMHAMEASLRKFGLAPKNFEYRPFIIKLLVEQVAGYYDPKVERFHLADWLEVEGQKPVMAHELTHALQDQHFNLRRFQKWPHGDGDAELAAHALIEGDATLAMTIYMARNPLVALAFSRSLATGVSTAQYDQAPRAMRETLIFPYLQGSEWATQLYKRGGWTMVSNAFTKLPLSSEQIMHPEKYFSYERPVKIVLPDISNLLEKAPAEPGKKTRVVGNQRVKASRAASAGTWRQIDSGINGEWATYLILDQFLNSVAESKRAAAGWGGDRYALYEATNNDLLLTWVTAWDTPNDAQEFFDAYVKRTTLRYPDVKELDSPDSNTGKRDYYSWQTSEGRVVIELRGQRVYILEGAHAGVDPKSIIESLS